MVKDHRRDFPNFYVLGCSKVNRGTVSNLFSGQYHSFGNISHVSKITILIAGTPNYVGLHFHKGLRDQCNHRMGLVFALTVSSEDAADNPLETILPMIGSQRNLPH